MSYTHSVSCRGGRLYHIGWGPLRQPPDLSPENLLRIQKELEKKAEDDKIIECEVCLCRISSRAYQMHRAACFYQKYHYKPEEDPHYLQFGIPE